MVGLGRRDREPGYWRTPEGRHEYYVANKERWKNYQRTPEEAIAYQKKYRAANRDKVSLAMRTKRENRLVAAIEHLGGKCSRCGGVFPSCVYDFHHVNRDEKEFTIGENMLVGEKRFWDEINKCVLLCSNCHRIVHKEEKHGG